MRIYGLEGSILVDDGQTMQRIRQNVCVGVSVSVGELPCIIIVRFWACLYILFLLELRNFFVKKVRKI